MDFAAKGGAGSVSLAEKLRRLEAPAEQLAAQLAGREAARKDALLVTPFAVRRRLGDLLALLRAEPSRARHVVASFFRGGVAVVSDQREVFAVGEVVVDADDGDVTRTFRAKVR